MLDCYESEACVVHKAVIELVVGQTDPHAHPQGAAQQKRLLV